MADVLAVTRIGFPYTDVGRGARRLEFRAYRAGDILEIVPAPDFLAEFAAARPQWTDGRPPGMAWTLTLGVDDKPIACGGVVEDVGREFAIWAYLSLLSRREWAFATARVRSAIGFLERDLRARSIRAGVRPGNDTARRYLERLGFAQEGNLVVAEGSLMRVMVRRTAPGAH